MGVGRVFATALEDVATGEVLAGSRSEILLAALAKESKVTLDPAEVAKALGPPKPPALGLPPLQQVLRDLPAMHPTDAAKAITAGGVHMRGLIEELAHLFPSIRKGMDARALGHAIGDGKAKTIATSVVERVARKSGFLDYLDLGGQGARKLFDDAVNSLDDASLAAKANDVRQRIPMHGDLETYVRRAAQELSPADGKKLLRAVHMKICEETVSRLRQALDSPALKMIVEAAFQKAEASTDDMARAFADELKAAFAGSTAADEVHVVIAGLDGTARARAVSGIFAAIADDLPTRALLESQFDDAGRHRLLTSFASFKKMYSAVRRRKALENLIGWMYEASRFVADLVVQSTAATQAAMVAALMKHGEVGVTVGVAFHHFDAVAPGLTTKGFRQATDVMGTIPVTAHNRTVHFLATAIESKGEAGVAAGIDQLVDLRKRLDAGALITEHGTFVLGKNLFLTAEEALRAIGVPPPTAAAIAIEIRGTIDAIVVSPLAKDVVERRYGTFLRAGIRYVAHPVSRAEMVRAAEALAPHVDLMIRDASGAAR